MNTWKTGAVGAVLCVLGVIFSAPHASAGGCSGDPDCSAPTPYCHVSGECRECIVDSHCPGSAPVCDAFDGTCRACQADYECTNAAAPACQPSGACGQCSDSNNELCMGATPTCDTGTGTCGPCTDDFDCISQPGTFACHVATGYCRECSVSNDSACFGSTPFCDDAAGTCRGCATNAECLGDPTESPYCHASGDCVDCASNSDCYGTHPFCGAAGSCLECVQASDCAMYVPQDPPGSGNPDPCFTTQCTSGQCTVTDSGSTEPQCSGCCISHNLIFFPTYTCFDDRKYTCSYLYARAFYPGYAPEQCVADRPLPGDSFCVCNSDDDCDDGQACTAEVCNPSSPSSGYDGCVVTNLDGQPCDDGFACTGPGACNMGFCEGGETLTCNDGNPCTNDSCTHPAGCTYTNVIDGLACNDGDACTETDTCTAGICGGEGSGEAPCDDGDPCTVDDLCTDGVCAGSTPTCNVTATKASLSMAPGSSLMLKWSNGTIDFADFGSPLVNTGYTLCVDHAGGAVTRLSVPPAESCGTKPCWTVKAPTSIKYKDARKPALNDGVTQVSGKAGAGKGKVQFKGKGGNLPSIGLGTGLSYPVTARVITTGEACWQATFGAEDEKKNEAESFKAVHKAP